MDVIARLEIELFYICACVCVCVCVDYICLLCAVVFIIVCMCVCVCVCVHDDRCATWLIWGCLLNICVAMCNGHHKTVGDFDQIKNLLYVVMILTKQQIYHHQWIMKNLNFLISHIRIIDENGGWISNVRWGGNIVVLRDMGYCNIQRRCPLCNGYRSRKWTRWHEFKSWTRLIAFHITYALGKGMNPFNECYG